MAIRTASRTLILLALAASVVAIDTGKTPPVAVAQPVVGHTTLVPSRPRTDVVRVLDGEVLDSALVGGRVVISGTFTQVKDTDGTVITQKYLAAYDETTGALDRSFNPVIDRPVYDVAASANAGDLFAIGEFSFVDGVARRKIAKLTAAGDLVRTFVANADSRVSAVVVIGGKVYVGGRFNKINTIPRVRLAALDATTGAIDPSFDFPVTEGLGADGDVGISALDVTADGSTLLVAHTGRYVAGQPRVGAALISLGATPTLRPWRTRLYENALVNISVIRITDAAIAADGSYAVLVATGGDKPPTNDTAVRFDTTTNGDDVNPTWVSRHFDTIYSVAISGPAVYVGGHFQFQEAPNSPEPWPGDTNINYGWGLGGGALVLVPQVVRREQLGALDPATGWAMPWNPGTDAYHGVTTLTVTPNGLLVGSDGSRLGGINGIGRHGFFDFRNVPPVEDPQTTLTDPINGQIVISGSQVTLRGAGAATAGIAKVQVDVRNDSTGLYRQADGSFAAPWYGALATLVSPGATASDWSLPITLPIGNFTANARTFAVGGVKDPTLANTRLTAVASDVTPPEIPVVSPPSGTQDFASNEITVSGTATDNRGVASMQVSVIQELTLDYLQPDGSVASTFYAFPVSVDSPGAPSVNWGAGLTIPNGVWTVSLQARDIDNNVGPLDVIYRVFVNDLTPTITVDSPVPDAVQAPGTITVSGTAADDSGVKEVWAFIRNRQTWQGVGTNGLAGYANWYKLPGIPIAQTSVPFNYVTPPMPAGSYDLQMQVVDLNGKLIISPTRVVSLNVPGDAGPDTVLAVPVDQAQTFTSTTVNLSGTATDPTGVTDVRFRVRRSIPGQSNKFLQSDGSWTSQAGLVGGAALATPGATATNWTRTFALGSEATYLIVAYAVDTAGQLDTTSANASRTYYVYPSDPDPSTTMAAPVNGGTQTGAKVTANGNATDNLAVNTVQIYIRNNATGKGPRIDGTIGTPQWVTTTLTNPDRPVTNWVHTSPTLPLGTYTVQVRARDSLGKLDLTPGVAVVTITA